MALLDRILGRSTPLVAKPAVADDGGAGLLAVAFDAGKQGRRLAAIPSNTTQINALITSYGRTAVARSRFLCTNNPYAIAAKETFVASVAGFGIKPSSLVPEAAAKKALQELWLDFIATADGDGITDFYGLQGLAAGELFEAGEVFLVQVPGRGDVPIAYRLLPSEMLPYEHSIGASSGRNRVEMGIEFDSLGNRVAYHFLRQHPGSMLTDVVRQYGTVRIPATEVMHLYKPIRAGQMRGVPHTLSSLVTLSMIDLYDDAELERKRVAALFAAFVTTAPQTGDDDDNGTHPLGSSQGSAGVTDQFQMEPGAVVDLNPGETITFSTPADVGQQYEAFQYRNLLRAAAGMGVPYANMTGDLRGTSYGSLRGGLVEFRRRVTAMQHHVMIFQFCRPVWGAFMDSAALAGLLPWTRAAYVRDRAKLIKVKWIPPKWDWVDPLKDRQAEKLAVDNGFKARSDVQEEEGYDPEETDDRIKSDQDRADLLKLKLNTGAVLPPSEDPASGAGDGGDPDAAPPKEKPDNA